MLNSKSELRRPDRTRQGLLRSVSFQEFYRVNDSLFVKSEDVYSDSASRMAHRACSGTVVTVLALELINAL